MGSCRDESEDHLTLDQEIILIFGNGDTLLIDSKEVMDTVQTQADTVMLSITSSERYSLIVNGSPSLDTVILKKGLNLILVRIGNEEYRINIFRLKSNESLLEDILFPSLVSWKGLKNNVFKYSINVPREITSVSLVAIKKNEFSKVNSYINDKDFVDKAPLELGSNLILIVCVSEDGSGTTEYLVEIFRQPLRQAELFELEISEGVLIPSFDAQIEDYILNLNDVESLLVFPRADSLAEVIVDYNGVKVTNEFDLENGSSEVKIEVTADDGITKKLYNIRIFRKPWHFHGNGPFAPKDGIGVLNFQNKLWLLGGVASNRYRQ